MCTVTSAQDHGFTGLMGLIGAPGVAVTTTYTGVHTGQGQGHWVGVGVTVGVGVCVAVAVLVAVGVRVGALAVATTMRQMSRSYVGVGIASNMAIWVEMGDCGAGSVAPRSHNPINTAVISMTILIENQNRG